MSSASAPPAAGPPPPPGGAGPTFAPLPTLARRIGITDENRRWWTLAAMCFGQGMVMLDTTVVVVALSTMQRHLHLSFTGIEWTIGAATLTHASLLVTGGRTGDMFGRRTVFLIGALVFAIGSATVGAAPSETVELIGRALTGVGAACMMPNTLGTITQVFSGKERPRAIGIWTGVSSIALTVGPALGGLLVSIGSWRLAFFINLPIAAIAVALTLLAVPNTRDEKAVRQLDYLGILLLSAGLTALVVALIQVTAWGWSSGRVLGLLAVSLVALSAFVVAEGKVPAPMLRPEYFRSRPLIAGVLCSLCVCVGLLAMLFYLAIYMQQVLGYGVLETGLKCVPLTIMIALVSPRAGAAMQKIAPRSLMVLGLLVTSAGIVITTRLTAHSSYAVLLPALVVVGIGVGITYPAMSTTAVSALPRAQASGASAMVSMARQLGFALGVALVGSAFATLARDRASHLLAALGLPASVREKLAQTAASAGTPSRGAVPPRVLDAIHDAIAHGVSHALVIPACIGVGGAIVVALLTAGTPAAKPVSGGRH
jgi:EmrB/QacA subfamily drug resistance transporter